jgi:UDP-glucose 4-epimerase
MTARVLVCGGAGYIGSHMVRLLRERGMEVVVFDNLSQGHAAAIPGVALERGDLRDRAALDAVFAAHDIDAVYHFAALISVGESVAAPDLYYRNNVCGTLNLLDAMRAAGVDRFVFSSSAAVYGEPAADRIAEDHPKAPISPYGRSKWMMEQVLEDHARAFGLRAVSFRYFNAAGADPSGGIGEAHDPETHLIPNVLLAALGQRAALDIFGDDYDTRDGTCIRDYIHVRDIAAAHLGALDWMEAHEGAHAFNLGNGAGFTTREVLDAAARVTGCDIPVRIGPRRAGDPAVLVADSSRARAALGWAPEHADLDAILASAWAWHRAPGYGPFAQSGKG